MLVRDVQGRQGGDELDASSAIGIPPAAWLVLDDPAQDDTDKIDGSERAKCHLDYVSAHADTNQGFEAWWAFPAAAAAGARSGRVDSSQNVSSVVTTRPPRGKWRRARMRTRSTQR